MYLLWFKCLCSQFIYLILIYFVVNLFNAFNRPCVASGEIYSASCSILVVKSCMLTNHLLERCPERWKRSYSARYDVLTAVRITEHSCLLERYSVTCVNNFLFTQLRNISDNFHIKVSMLLGFTSSKSSLIIILQFQILSLPHENAVELHSVAGGLLGTNNGHRSSPAQTTAKVNSKIHSQ
jgi:hypothetical protein